MTLLRISDIGQRMSDKGIALRCEACGSERGWTIPHPSEDTPDIVQQVGMISGGGIPASGLQTFDFVPLVCNHCGFTRLFLTEFLLREGADGDRVEPEDHDTRLAGLEVRGTYLSADPAEAKAQMITLKNRLRESETGLATLTERIGHLPSKGFIVSMVAGGLALLAAIIAFADSIRAWIGG